MFLMKDDKLIFFLCLGCAFGFGVLVGFGWFWGSVFLW